jgi:hypothetical protein
MRKSLLICFLILCLTAGMCFAAENVIGKAHIKKGTELGGVLVINNKILPFVFISAKDQDVYILQSVPPMEGVHRGGYSLEGEGFLHMCPEHGVEAMPEMSTIGLPIEMIEQGIVSLTFF